MSSEFAVLCEQDWRFVRGQLDGSGTISRIRSALLPLAAFYPAFPLRGLWTEQPSCETAGLDKLESTIASMFRRDLRDVMLVQAIFVALHLDAQVLHVMADSALLQISEIEQYPETELSRRVGSMVRATVNTLAHNMAPGGSIEWSNYFWNRGLELRPCRSKDG
jgi:hypothetical protein